MGLDAVGEGQGLSKMQGQQAGQEMLSTVKEPGVERTNRHLCFFDRNLLSNKNRSKTNRFESNVHVKDFVTLTWCNCI